MRTSTLLTAAAGGAALGAGLLLGRGARDTTRDAIEAMDPVEQAREILWLVKWFEFGWDTEMALSFALFRTYAVPSISTILAATGELVDDANKRYDDTELVITEWEKHGFEHERGRTALKRMNAMHAAFDIDPDDTLYTLTTFICEPVRWQQRWGWREYTEHEKRAVTEMWRQVGHRMGLRDLPAEYAWYDEFNQRYEAERFAFHPDNRTVADASVQLLLDLYLPSALHGIGEVAVRAMMDQPLLDAVGYDPAPPAVVTALDAVMRARGAALRLLPARRTAYDLTTRPHRTYPHGYEVSGLGTWPDEATRARANAAVAAVRAARA